MSVVHCARELYAHITESRAKYIYFFFLGIHWYNYYHIQEFNEHNIAYYAILKILNFK